MSDTVIERWIDMDGPEFQKVLKPTFTRKIIQIGIDAGVIKIDNAGYMWQNGEPVYTELDGKLVGLRFAAKAVN